MSANDHSAAATIRPKGSLIQQVRRMIVIVLIVLLSFLILLAYFQRDLIYHPTASSRVVASDFGIERGVRDVTVMSHDGLYLHGWLVLAASVIADDSQNLQQQLADGRPVVLYFPGNAGHRGFRADKLLRFQSMDVHTLLVDYRGYGDNAGHPSEFNLARDARSVWDELTENLEVAPHRIVIYGESLGGGVAISLASELCQAGFVPAGLIAQSTFDSLVAAAQFHFPYLPVSWLMIDRFPSVTRIPQVTCPILSIHGKRDSIVPFASGQRLFDAAPATSAHGVAKRMLVLPHTDHNDVYGGEDDGLLITELAHFFRERTAERRAPPSDQ